MAKPLYFAMPRRNKIKIQDSIKATANLRNAVHHSVKDIFISPFV